MRNEKAMLVPKVRRVWLVMECELPTGKGEKIYLPAVLVPKEKKKRANLRQTLMSLAKKCLKPAIKIFAGVTAGLLTAMWLVPIEIEQRGYNAIGGEHLLIILVAFAAIHITGMILKRGEKI